MAGKTRPAKDEAPVSIAEVLEWLGDVVTFEPGHHLRRTRCILCAEMIGGRPFRVHLLADTRSPACACGGLSGTIFVVCAAHDLQDDNTLMRLALDRAGRHHGNMP